MLEKLYENGADINQTSAAGIGPLYLAIKNKSLDCAKFLIDAKAKIYFQDEIRRDFSPVFIAITTAQQPMIEMICDEVKKELDNYRDSQGYSPMMLALKLGLHDVVNYLSLRGYNLN